ncbi:hypothetical protein U1Q18_011757, partial [Sarracenia purpurea var. burkii]
VMRQRRIDRGALTLVSAEVKFQIDTETQDPLDIGMYQIREANQMNEEFILAANEIFIGMGHCQILLLLAGKATIGVLLCVAAGAPNVAGVGHWVAVKAVAFTGEGLHVATGVAAVNAAG